MSTGNEWDVRVEGEAALRALRAAISQNLAPSAVLTESAPAGGDPDFDFPPPVRAFGRGAEILRVNLVPEPEPEPEPEQIPKPDPEPEAGTEPDPDPEPERVTESASDPEPKSAPGPDPAPEADRVVNCEAEPDPDPEPKFELPTEPVPLPAIELDLSFESMPEPAHNTDLGEANALFHDQDRDERTLFNSLAREFANEQDQVREPAPKPRRRWRLRQRSDS